MSRLILYASGHRHLYSSDEDEIRAISGENARSQDNGLGTVDIQNPAVHWWPSSLDFRSEARRHSVHRSNAGSLPYHYQCSTGRSQPTTDDKQTSILQVCTMTSDAQRSGEYRGGRSRRGPCGIA